MAEEQPCSPEAGHGGGSRAVLVPIIGLLAVSTAVFALLWLLHPLAGRAGRGAGRRIEARSRGRALRLVEASGRGVDRPRVAVETRLASRQFDELLKEFLALAQSAAGREQAEAFFQSEAARGATPPVAFTFPRRSGPETLTVYAIDARRRLCYCRLASTGEALAVRAEAYEKLAHKLAAMGGGTVGRFALPYYVSLEAPLRERLGKLGGSLVVTTVAADVPRALKADIAGMASREIASALARPDPATVILGLRLPREIAMARGLAEAMARGSEQVSARHMDATTQRKAVQELAASIGRRADDLDDALVLQHGERARVVPASEMVGRSGGGTAGAARFVGESVVAKALDALLSERGLLCFTEGHGERRVGDASKDGISRAVAQLKGRGFRATALDLARDATVPPECTVLVIPGPQRPFGAEAEKAITRHLARGGRLALLLDPPRSPLVLGGLLKRYGITVPKPTEPLVASRSDLEPGLLVVHVDRGLDFTKQWSRGPAVFLTACELVVGTPASDALEALVVARSLDAPTLPQAPNLREGSRSAAAKPPPCLIAAVRPKSGGRGGPKLLVFGDVDAFSNRVLASSVAPGNLPLLLDALLWLAE